MCGCSNGNDCGGLTCGEGVAGLNGLNAFTVTTGDFTQPAAINTPVAVDVSALGQYSGSFAGIGQYIFIEGGGIYVVTAKTPTVLTAEIPDATTLAFNHNIAGAGSTVAFPANVSPSGPIGPAGNTGGPGGDGTDGTTLLSVLYSATAATGTSFSPLHTSQTLPSSSGDLLFPSVGSIVRVHLAAVLATASGSNSSNYWKGDVEITLGGVSIVLPIGAPFLSTRSYLPFNGMTATVDIVAISLSPLTLVADVKAFETGIGAYSGTAGYLVLPTSANSPVHLGNPFSSGQTTGVDQSSNVVLQVNGRRTSVGSPSGAPSLFLPMLKVERLVK